MRARCIFNDTDEPVPGSPLRGQFCLRGPFPYGPRPDRDDNVFFMGELDAVWDRDRATAERVRAAYLKAGFNHAIFGPVWSDHGYDGQYPVTDFLGDPDRYVAFLRWWNAPFSLMALPDSPPYLIGPDDDRRWDLARIARDLTPFYAHPEIQRLVVRVGLAYEISGMSIGHFAEGFDWLTATFPHARRYHHNPPGHLGAGLSSEDEEACARSMARHGIHGQWVQCKPIDNNDDHLPLPQRLARAIYDVWDVKRRFTGVCEPSPLLLPYYHGAHDIGPNSPWGAPVLGVDGQPLESVPGEYTAHPLYHDAATPDAMPPEWGAGMRTIPGIVDCLDGT